MVSSKISNINLCIVENTQYQPLYRRKYPIPTIVSSKMPNINHCIVKKILYQPLHRRKYPLSTIVSSKLPTAPVRRATIGVAHFGLPTELLNRRNYPPNHCTNPICVAKKNVLAPTYNRPCFFFSLIGLSLEIFLPKI